jgi:Xaa-Pro aminopeptidase
MVFHVIPNLHIPGIGGVGVTETVLVTEKGGEALTNCERTLTVK